MVSSAKSGSEWGLAPLPFDKLMAPSFVAGQTAAPVPAVRIITDAAPAE